MLEELSLYDKVIIKSYDKIPKVYGEYKLSKESTHLKIDDRDLQTFKEIYNLAPPKKGETIGSSKGSGNGEIALYWLFHHQQNSIPTRDARNGADPDLIIGDVGCEVKAYKNHDAKLGLGRFGADRDNLKILNVIFGFYSLISIVDFKPMDPHKRNKQITSTNFNGHELLDAFDRLFLFVLETTDEKLKGIFVLIKNNIQALLDSLGNPQTAEQATSMVLTNICKSKLSIKPGNEGYLANIKDDGDIFIYRIDFEKLNNLPIKTLAKNIEIQQSFIYINFKKLFL
jgi:hypothetical protein